MSAPARTTGPGGGRARSLGGRLAGWTAIATAIAVLVFALAAAAALWLHERAEQAVGEAEEGEPTAEVVEQLTIALAVTTPVILLLAVVATRRLARRVTDRLDGVVAAAAAMTEDRLAERLPVSPADDEVDRLAVALNGLFGRLDHGIAAQRQFVADASHELRTPLTVLRSELEVARRRPRTVPEWEAIADRVAAEVARMTAMADALLRLARAGAVAPTARPVDLRTLVDDVVARWSAAAAAAGVTLRATRGGRGARGRRRR
ncbi:MAG: HAMP domain-containing protein [Kofleriaceae bacterium]|nr:HAMP domain-containing protein [Kofleriaceae bacterium]